LFIHWTWKIWKSY